MRGVLAKVNLALARLPKFHGAAAYEQPSDTLLAGRIHIGPDPDYLERAFDRSKYGEVSTEPWLEVTIPSLTDPTLAPQGQHVMSVYAQWAPYALRGAVLGSGPRGLRGRDRQGDRRTCTRSAVADPRARDPDAGRSRAALRPDRRPHLPRRARARSALRDAARARLGAAPHADRRAIPVWRRHASGRRSHRRAGRACGARRAEGSHTGRP